MTPHTTRQGIPVCRRGDVCGVMEADQFFATDKYNISAQGRARLANFFQSTGAVSYIITGHTDSRASDAYNMRLSYNRANSVAVTPPVCVPNTPQRSMPSASRVCASAWA